jgi:hypothetical protein
MKRTRTMTKALLSVAALFTFGSPVIIQAKTITIASDKYWTVADSNGVELGNAQNVCRFSGAPEGCPQGATLFGSSQWTAIPGANWIWTPNTTGTSSAAANAEFTFKTPFYLCGSPQTANISVAAYNSTDVFVNGSLILSTSNFSTASTATVPAAKLAQGLNMIEAKVKNAASGAGCSDQYQCNPAGVVVKLTVTDNLDPWPTCKDGNQTYQVGEFQDLSCPAGQVGSNSRACICIGNFATWWSASNSCQTPPPPPVTCSGANNTSFGVNATESVSCPTGKVGTAFHTCQSDGQWSSTDFSGCTLPAVGAGAICGNSSQGYTATCPSGTACGSRRISKPTPAPLWCFLVLWIPPVCHDVGEYIQTSDWFCD